MFSFDGYTQCICRKGHYFIGSCDSMVCNFCIIPSCHAESAWENIVDCSEIENAGFIPMEALAQFMRSMEVAEQCSLGFRHILQPAVYRIPTKRETDPLRTSPERKGAE